MNFPALPNQLETLNGSQCAQLLILLYGRHCLAAKPIDVVVLETLVFAKDVGVSPSVCAKQLQLPVEHVAVSFNALQPSLLTILTVVEGAEDEEDSFVHQEGMSTSPTKHESVYAVDYRKALAHVYFSLNYVLTKLCVMSEAELSPTQRESAARKGFTASDRFLVCIRCSTAFRLSDLNPASYCCTNCPGEEESLAGRLFLHLKAGPLDSMLLPKALRQDARIADQGFLISSLLRSRFVLVSPDLEVTSPDLVLLKGEYEKTLQHKSDWSLRYAEPKRLKILVRGKRQEDMEMQAKLDIKLEKRVAMPPWITEESSAQKMGQSSISSDFSDVALHRKESGPIGRWQALAAAGFSTETFRTVF